VGKKEQTSGSLETLYS